MNAPQSVIDDDDGELMRLVERLQDTQQRILALTHGRVDAVVPASGNLLLLPQTQVHFRDQAIAYQAFAAERTAILDALPAHVALLGPTGEIRAINAVWLAFARQLDKRPGLAVGENYLDFWTSAAIFGNVDVAAVASGIKAVLGGAQLQFDLEFWIEDLQARPWFRLVVAPLAGSAERGAVVMHVDITDQKANEEQIRQMQRLEALGQLTGGVAHDFNNLLMVIMGNGESLLASLEHDAQRRGWAELIVMASERGAALTNRLLAFARRQALAPQAIDLRDLLSGIAMLLDRTLGENVRIALPPGIEPNSVLADRSQLENAVINLCLNARDAMPQGGVISMSLDRVEIDAAGMPGKPDLHPGSYVKLTISDTGSGMDAGTLARSFEPFFTTKPAGKGSGLGLSVVFGFVWQSGGNVSIASSPGSGTDVRIWLPSADLVVPRQPMGHGIDFAGAGERILLVEDDDMVRQSVTRQLCGLGYRVVAASGAREALDVLRSDGDFDLLFTDLVMTGDMDGLALVGVVREQHPHMPLLITSGYADALDGATRDRFAANLLAKPYKQQELAAKLGDLLPRHRVGGRQ